MRKIFIIGTLHAHLTPNSEIRKILEKYRPNQVLVEIAQTDIDKGKIKTYPPEMIFAYNWAKKNKVFVKGFDSKINVVKKGLSKKQIDAIVKDDIGKLGKLTWKDLNKSRNNDKMFTKTDDLLIDWAKDRKRQFEMLANVKNAAISEGNIVMITGCGHLDFFEKHLRDAIFPFR